MFQYLILTQLIEICFDELTQNTVKTNKQRALKNDKIRVSKTSFTAAMLSAPHTNDQHHSIHTITGQVLLVMSEKKNNNTVGGLGTLWISAVIEPS